MRPHEYLEIKLEQDRIIRKAKRLINSAHSKAQLCAPPKKQRPATPDDIVVGAVIWHSREKPYGGPFWNVVEEPLHYGDPFKAYTADDGCRYGLCGAYVELKGTK